MEPRFMEIKTGISPVPLSNKFKESEPREPKDSKSKYLWLKLNSMP